MIEEQEFNKIHGRESSNSTLIAIRPHFYYSSAEEVKAIISEDGMQKLEGEQEQIRINSASLKSKISICLKKKIPHKPLHLLKIRKRISKTTKKVSYIVEDSDMLKAIYDYEEMCDFVSSEGNNVIPQESSYSIDKNLLLNFVKDKLQERIANQSGSEVIQNIQQDQNFKNLIKPEYFLKNFNAVPPKCDFFVNKTKNKDEKQFNYSLNINYEDPIPVLAVQIPKALQETQLFGIIQSYLAKRPCWLKNTLLYVLKQGGHNNFTINELKNVLKYLCYTFKNGPWKHTFCLFGFDPRKTYKSVIYQNVSLKLKKKEAEDYEQEVEEEFYDPSFSDISNRCMRAYQIGDICLEEVKQVINGKLISEEGECTKQHGWLSANEQNHILKVMKEHKDKKNK